ncbi:MAG: peptide-methionine (S)-S-oxide reductase [Candidatus Microsaccharimonas sossegonensis]|uniref:Peptide methionine sulfoxide reductase MsrA n=1 Tax=Candidatus Microsaccharimonas sossegonensis TaxID=2506948 RepID=A0A4Q0AGM8_9BACT|nr:MAG: peptide-methionine (S)-S-oxide reductase [Candidatus Microsaccharimonas sossegonensis]
MTTYVVAGGCFWCLDAVYRRLKGVSKVVSGYTGGASINPTYEEVSTGETGHAEAVKITFDESIIPSDVILDLFFLIHDPTTLNRQGADVGTQYRSAMYYSEDTQRAAFEAAAERAKKHWIDPLTTEVNKLGVFYPAEAYHQDYFNKHPGSGYCSIVIAPKIVKARSAYTTWFKTA